MTAAEKRRIWFENFLQAFDTILSHKFRSFLTVLGVLIGVITVILVASILTGLRGRIVSMIEEFGTTNIYAFHLNTGVQIGRRPRKEMERKPLNMEHVRAIKDRCDAVQDVGCQLFPVRLTDRSIKYQGESFYEGSIEGITPNNHEIAHHELAMGRFLTETDNLHRQFNCVIGHAVYEALFPNIQPIGKDILVAGKRFQVVGVLQKRKSTFLGENQEDKTVSIPLLTFKKLSPQDDWLFLIIQSRSGQLAQAMDQVEQVLRVERRLKADDDNDFSLHRRFDHRAVRSGGGGHRHHHHRHLRRLGLLVEHRGIEHPRVGGERTRGSASAGARSARRDITVRSSSSRPRVAASAVSSASRSPPASC